MHLLICISLKTMHAESKLLSVYLSFLFNSEGPLYRSHCCHSLKYTRHYNKVHLELISRLSLIDCLTQTCNRANGVVASYVNNL